MSESLADLIQAELPSSVPGTKCHVGIALANMTPEDRATAEAAILRPNHEIPSSVIQRAMQKQGHHLGADSMAKHRRRSCRCWDKV